MSTMFLLLREQKEAALLGLDGTSKATIKLPLVFSLPVRKDLIRRAWLSAFTARLQPKGRDPMAGKRTSARSYGVGLGIARVPRIPGTMRAAFIPSAVGGRRAFPPSPLKKIHEEINKKEMKLAVASALAATAVKELVQERGHRFSASTLPVVVESKFEELGPKVKDVKEVLKKVGVWEDIERAHKGKKVKAGKGKMRGRRYKVPVSVLFVLSSTEVPAYKALRNLPGVDVVTPQLLSILHLAPGGVPGRLTVITEEALKGIERRFEWVKPL